MVHWFLRYGRSALSAGKQAPPAEPQPRCLQWVQWVVWTEVSGLLLPDVFAPQRHLPSLPFLHGDVTDHGHQKNDGFAAR